MTIADTDQGRARHDADAETIRKVLSAAGWTLTEDAKLWNTAELEYHAGSITLQVSQTLDRKFRHFNFIVTRDDGSEIAVIVDYADSLEEVLKVIVGFQEELTDANAREKIQVLYENCEDIFVVIDDKLVSLEQAWLESKEEVVEVGAALAKRLLAAGWEKTSKDSERVSLRYKKGQVGLSLAESEPGVGGNVDAVLLIAGAMPLVVYFEDALAGFLDLLVEYQDKLSSQTQDEFLKRLAREWPKTFVLLDGQPKLLTEA